MLPKQLNVLIYNTVKKVPCIKTLRSTPKLLWNLKQQKIGWHGWQEFVPIWAFMILFWKIIPRYEIYRPGICVSHFLSIPHNTLGVLRYISTISIFLLAVAPYDIWNFDTTMHSGAFCQFPFQWIYYYGSNKSTGKETSKMHLCAME